MNRIVVALSGGVDSAVAAHQLLRQGHEVAALFMKNWEEPDGECRDKDDLLAACAVADCLNIDLDVVNFAAQYHERVFTPFLEEYREGRTPNPDVLCNSEIKFSVLIDYVSEKYGTDAVATGHYARIQRDPNHSSSSATWQLVKAADTRKDQTYFLHRLSQRQLARAVFPIGDLLKSDVREIARDARLPNWQRKDSTGICFIGERDFARFLKGYLPTNPGDILTPEGRRVGEHEGVLFYTIGQRRGLKIGGVRGGDERPWYVAAKDPATNVLIVVQDAHHPLLRHDGVRLRDFHWISGAPESTQRVISTRVRHGAYLIPSTITRIDEDGVHVAFGTEQYGLAEGQYGVLYDGNICLGGGVIAPAQ